METISPHFAKHAFVLPTFLAPLRPPPLAPPTPMLRPTSCPHPLPPIFNVEADRVRKPPGGRSKNLGNHPLAQRVYGPAIFFFISVSRVPWASQRLWHCVRTLVNIEYRGEGGVNIEREGGKGEGKRRKEQAREGGRREQDTGPIV